MRIERKTTVAPTLRVDDNFATLLNIEDDGTFVYEVRFFSATVEALRVSANTVRLSIRRDQPPARPDVFHSARDLGDNRTFISDVLTAESRAKDAKRDVRSAVLATTTVDLTARFNNSLASSVSEKRIATSTDVLGTQRVMQLKTVTELRNQNINPPVLQVGIDTGPRPSAGQAQRAALDLVSMGIDPSSIVTNHEPVAGTHSSFSGYGVKITPGSLQTSTSNDPLSARRDVLLGSLHTRSPAPAATRADLPDNALVPVVSDQPVRQLLNIKMLRVPANIGLDDFYVIFELVDVLGVVLERLMKRVQHGLLVRVFNTPKVPPRVGIAPVQFPGKNVIEIEQVDTRANRIKIMRRRMLKTDPTHLDSIYEQVVEVPLKKRDGLMKFIDVVDNSSTLLYRCIPIGPGGLLGSEFTNAIAPTVKGKLTGRHPRSLAASMNARTVSGGIAITMTALPMGTVAAAVVRRDMTLFDAEPAFLDTPEPIRLVGPSLSNMTFLDDDVKQDHIYEYSCLLFFEDGTQVTSTARALKKYIPLKVGVADLHVSDLRIVRGAGSLDVTFNVSSRLSDEGLSIVKRALEKQDILSLYEDELLQERDKLQKLIAHSISRIDITTGIEESFGTFTGTTFSDVVEGRRAGVSALHEGHKYRYSIATLVRDPETLFDDFVKSSRDVSTGRAFSFKPSIFRHPIALNRGTLVTRETLRRNHPEDDFAHGILGNVQELDVTIEVAQPRIQDVRVVRIDRRTAAVQWNTEGETARVDHFAVVKERLGQTTIAGKMHNVSQSRTFEFFDKIGPDDIGEVTYRVIPILNNYARGVEAISRALVILDNRSLAGAL